jgi:two-component system, NtrC family, response regulator AtoC
LRRRRGDVPLLIEHFRRAHERTGRDLRFTPDAIDRLNDYAWPGNVRELRNLIERLQILHPGRDVSAGDLPAEFGRAAQAAAGPTTPPPADSDMVPLAEIERRHIERVLHATGWNKARAARVLAIDVKTLNKKIRDFALAQRRD